MSQIGFVVPGRLNQLTGGYLYDRHIIEGLRARGRAVKVIELSENNQSAAFSELGAGTRTIIDGLAFRAVEKLARAEARRLRLIALVHHPLAEETGLSRAAVECAARLEAEMLPLFQGVVCPSRKTAAAIRSYGVRPERIAVIPPGTAKPTFYRRRRSGRPVLLCVASLVPRKGHRVLVEALARVRDLDWRLLCIGSLERDAATVCEIRRTITAFRLGRRVRLGGERPPEAIARAYQAADIFVLPSFHEGYGMAYAEAMAHGLPVIATTAGAIPETVPRRAGLLVRAGDSICLARALRRVLADSSAAARLAAGSRATGDRLPDWTIAAEQWEAALDRFSALSLPP
ncbi:MAG: glycosyltransferase family 4 protein [Stellaceae bacterium]